VYGPLTFSAKGGEAPYTYTIKYGDLPHGLELSTDGILSGTPTVPGYYFFSVQAEDKNQAVGYEYYMITVNGYVVFFPLIER
ncbi:MAG: Ig domain-containing protein, partial [Anaerolineales bacterium]